MRKRSLVLACVFTGMAILAAACGGDDGGGGSDARLDEGVKSGVKEQLGASSTAATSPAVEPKNIQEYEAFWKTQREAVIKKIKDGGWKLDPATNTVNGPEGYKIDLSKCPTGWSNTEGLTDTEIKIGQSTAF